MIERVLAAGARDVRSIMVPRGRMVWLDVADSPQTVVRKFASGHSRLPLCAGDAANVLGVLHFKDVLPLLSNPAPSIWWNWRASRCTYWRPRRC